MSQNTLTINLTEDMKRFLMDKSDEYQLTSEDIVLKLLGEEIDSKCDLGKGYCYDKNAKRLFNSRNEDIRLTKKQNSIMELLLENRGQVVSIEKIKEFAWNDKNVSIFTLRNMIKFIRDKTYYEIIKNHSALGYSIGLNQIK